MYVSFAAMGCCETTRDPSGYFSIELLATHLQHVLARRRPWHIVWNLIKISTCNTFRVCSQSKRLEWPTHTFRVPNDRLQLPRRFLLGEVKGLCPPGRPRSSFNDIAWQHAWSYDQCQHCRPRRPWAYKDAQDRLLWRHKTCSART